MAGIHETFSKALKERIGSRLTLAFAHTEQEITPGLAHQAEIPPETVSQALADAIGGEYYPTLTAHPASHEFLSKVSISFARRHGLLGLASNNGHLPVALSDLAQWPQIEALSKLFQKEIRPVFAPREEILRAINAAYQQQTGQAQRVIEELDGREILQQIESVAKNEDLLDIDSRAPVIKLVNLMLFEAVKRRASDVHVQPYEDRLVVRFRVDGVLFDIFTPPKALQEEILSRIKVMGNMNIAERRLAQDGRATVEVGDRVVDLRISTLPTSFGERAVIRLLDKSARLYRLEELGMPEAIQNSFRRLIQKDHGIILVTGPTGSGKSTTLYAALQELNSAELNILTLEDPIEYRLEGISQTQVSEKKGMTFASGLRHVLRQDPDIIMLGEIRDSETARMAIQSALTGHLVFSTLHTNDAAGAVTRLIDLGVEPYLVASSLLGVLAQRLVRRICPHCCQPITPSAEDLHRWDLHDMTLPANTLYQGAGCAECMQTGYQERIGIFELLSLNDDLRELILHQAEVTHLKSKAAELGMSSLWSNGIAKACEGKTTMDEILRVTSRG